MAMLKVKLTPEQKIMFRDYLPEMAIEIPDEKFDEVLGLTLKMAKEFEDAE